MNDLNLSDEKDPVAPSDLASKLDAEISKNVIKSATTDSEAELKAEAEKAAKDSKAKAKLAQAIAKLKAKKEKAELYAGYAKQLEEIFQDFQGVILSYNGRCKTILWDPEQERLRKVMINAVHDLRRCQKPDLDYEKQLGPAKKAIAEFKESLKGIAPV